MHRRARLFVVTSAVLAASAAVGTWDARAQIPLPTSTTTTTAPPDGSTTTTTQSPPPTLTPGSTTSTTEPTTTTEPSTPPSSDPGPGPTTPSTGPTTTVADPIDGGDGGDVGTPADIPVPSAYQSLVSGVKRSPANSTRKLLDALAPLQDLGVSPADAVALAFGRFPVGGPATFVDDWWYPRSAAPFHLHQGTDIMAETGTPVRSPADGVLTRSNGGLGGLSAKVTQADGTYFYMAHLSSVPPEQVEGQQVKVGDVIGYVGNTGDAVGGPPHLHFEIHMAPAKNQFLYPPPAAPTTVTIRDKKGRKQTITKPAPAPKPVIVGDLGDPALYGRGPIPANNPKPFLDQWLNEALANVPTLIARLEAGRPRAILATGMLRRFTDGGGLFSAPAGPPRSQLLWASSASPSGGTLQLAEAEASAVAGELDWSLLARREQARVAAAQENERHTAALLDPLTPPALRFSLH
jgi:murein DD-endopeptidase MepM/ murein hydrolase activator NlpD